MSTVPPTPSQGISESWNERMRMIRLRRKKEAFRLRDEFRVVPRWLKITIIVLYLVALVVFVPLNLSGLLNDGKLWPDEVQGNPALAALAIAGAITGMAVVAAVYLFLLGYVYRDAKRRGMNAALWTFLAMILSPNIPLGFILYFLIREPLPYSCPRCSHPVGPRFNFCPNCKCDLHPSCPNCKREVAETDKFCPYCAYELRSGSPGEPRPSSPGALPEPGTAAP